MFSKAMGHVHRDRLRFGRTRFTFPAGVQAAIDDAQVRYAALSKTDALTAIPKGSPTILSAGGGKPTSIADDRAERLQAITTPSPRPSAPSPSR
jgi:hypothetical protein